MPPTGLDTTATAAPTASGRGSMRVQVMMTLVWGALGAAGLVPAIMSPMMFDAPGSTSNAGTLTLFVGVASFPLVCLVSVVLAWILFALRRRAASVRVLWLPLASLLAVVGAIAWLSLTNGGRLA